ncbi:uncharacterized protein ARMOST_19591 [Armillaria ostoyae]|uniref:Reverse transcriptase domain-containing protein n=1 Tax=Armillaria ostoyae TaxID=47428 RepID=A0A284S506_ARMOS|nr:uncharacterized protein ARMOST_19591 [Armillaria ostoyae]
MVAPESVSWGGQGETGNSTFAVQAQPVVYPNDPPLMALGHSMPRRMSRQEYQKRLLKAAGDANATAMKKTATGQEAASVQAVKRGHSVTIVEVPDEDDDTAFQIWLAKEWIPTVVQKEATSDEPARSSPMPVITRGWCKPFEVDWTLRAVCKARNDNAARAALFVWTHRNRVPELTTELLEQICKGGETAQEQLYELREPPRYLHTQFEYQLGLAKSLSDSKVYSIALKSTASAPLDYLLLSTPLHVLRGLRSANQLKGFGSRVTLLIASPKPTHSADLRLCDLSYSIWHVHNSRRQSNDRDFMLDVQLIPCTGQQVLQTRGLLDSGCTSSAINRAFVQKHELDTKKAAVPIAVYNTDGTRNKRIDFAVTDLGTRDLYLGHDWLKRHNPVINWNTGTVIFGRCQCVTNPFPLPNADPDDRWDEELEDGDTILAINMEQEAEIRAVHHANDLAAAANAEKHTKTFEEMVPPDYCSFHDLFSKENFDELPARKLWDHAIELVPNAKSTLDCKVYLLNRNEQEQLDKFLDENLELGRIRESKSPFASPFFFVKKKDSSLHPIQDYRKLNEMTIKNRYPLPLISELIDKLQRAKYFTKLDIRWGYNNVRIKKGDEEKATFHTNRGLFEPTVMFFRLTNSPTTFQ